MSEEPIIRLNKVLRELNISLDTAIQLLAQFGHEIDARPTVKITAKLYHILKDNYKGFVPIKKKSANFKIDEGYKKDSQYPEFWRNNPQEEYLKNHHYYLLGKVKWYYNRQTNGEYGFLATKYSDVRFKGETVEGISPHNLREGDLVIAEIPEWQLAKKKQLNPTKVTLLKNETDLLLLHHLILLNDDHKSVYEASQNAIRSTINIEDTEITESLQRQLGDFQAEHRKLPLGIAHFYLDYLLLTKQGIDAELVSYLIPFCSKEKKYWYWSKGLIELTFSEIEELIREKIYNNLEECDDLLNRLNSDEQEVILEYCAEKLLKDSSSEVKQFGCLLNLTKKFNVEFRNVKFPDTIYFKLWHEGYSKEFPLDIVYNFIIEKYLKPEEKSGAFQDEVALIIKKIDPLNLPDFLAKTLFHIDVIRTNEQFNTIDFFLNHLEDGHSKSKYLEDIISKATEFQKIRFFINDHIETINFNEVVLYTAFLSQKEQILFFKKIIALKAANKIELSINDIKRILTVDYKTVKSYQEFLDFKIDYSLALVIHIIDSLSKTEKLKYHAILEFLSNMVKDPKDVIQIGSFFDKCPGRTIIDRETDKKDNSEEIKWNLIMSDFPRFAQYCDGKKAINKISGQEVKCKRSGRDFLWCENQQCYRSGRKTHELSEWRDYNLLDITRILELTFDDDSYGQFVGYVNKANRFLSHLNCRECGHLMHPSNKNNYGFYRVSHFRCKNDACTRKGEEVYLSHCLNGRCMDIIDSRDTVRCYENKIHGWYICNNCYACCSNEKRKARSYILETTGQQTVQAKGHKGHVICCKECGYDMEELSSGKEQYEKFMSWLLENKETNSLIKNYGERQQDGGYWFVLQYEGGKFHKFQTFINQLISCGFQIPNYEENSTQYLVSEPFSNKQGKTLNKHFKCVNCNHELKIIQGMDNYHSIVNYHFSESAEYSG